MKRMEENGLEEDNVKHNEKGTKNNRKKWERERENRQMSPVSGISVGGF